VAGVTQIEHDTVHLDTVEYAKVEDDCRIGEWSLASYHLHGGRSSPQGVVIGSHLAVIGGWGDLDLIDVFHDVQVGTIRPDGSLAPWRTSPGRLPTGVYGHATALVESPGSTASLLLSVGGQPGTGAYANWISFAYIHDAIPVPDGIGIWRIAPSGHLPAGRAGHSAIHVRGRLYVIGGSGPNGGFFQDVLSAELDPGVPL
jgi:N-acetylneuraminic acid mutarotase